MLTKQGTWHKDTLHNIFALIGQEKNEREEENQVTTSKFS